MGFYGFCEKCRVNTDTNASGRCAKCGFPK